MAQLAKKNCVCDVNERNEEVEEAKKNQLIDGEKICKRKLSL